MSIFFNLIKFFFFLFKELFHGFEDYENYQHHHPSDYHYNHELQYPLFLHGHRHHRHHHDYPHNFYDYLHAHHNFPAYGNNKNKIESQIIFYF